jgi:acetylornithine aminotransferase
MDELIANDFFDDPALDAHLENILVILKEKQAKINGVKPPAGSLQESYANALERLGKARGTPLFYPYLGSGIGNGPFVELLDGSIKYDMIGGIGVYFFGHSHPRLIKASLKGAICNTLMQGNLQQNAIALEVMERLIKLSGLDHCFLSSSGAMAVENALKVAFQYRRGSTRILTFEGCFSGRTLALSQITDKPSFREGLPSFLSVDYLPFFNPLEPEQSVDRAMHQLEIFLKRYPGQHALILMEPIQGEGGFRVGSKEFFIPILQRVKREGIVTLLDEIQTFGRLEKPFAFQLFELEPYTDIVTIGKMSEVCATLFKDEIKPKGPLLSQTFTAATTALFGARETLKLFDELSLFGPDGKNSRIFKWAERSLHKLSVQGPFGRDAMVSFIVGNGTEIETKSFLNALFKKGVIAFSAGTFPMKVRMLVPAPVTEEKDIEKVFQIVEETLDAMSP